MPSNTRPKLPQLQTPMTATFPSELSALSATFPSELSALSAKTPLTGYVDFIKQEDMKTPITPPTAYTDFLMKMASPVTAGAEKTSGRTTPTSAPTSAPSTSSSEHSDCSCNCETHKSPTSTTALPSSFPYPSSARSTSWLGRLRIPQSPAMSNCDSPLSAPLTASSAVRSPFSARSSRGTRSPYDWDSKGRYFDVKSPKASRSSIREVREIVTRTVTYTPRMSPAPKGKRRKIE